MFPRWQICSGIHGNANFDFLTITHLLVDLDSKITVDLYLQKLCSDPIYCYVQSDEG